MAVDDRQRDDDVDRCAVDRSLDRHAGLGRTESARIQSGARFGEQKVVVFIGLSRRQIVGLIKLRLVD